MFKKKLELIGTIGNNSVILTCYLHNNLFCIKGNLVNLVKYTIYLGYIVGIELIT